MSLNYDVCGPFEIPRHPVHSGVDRNSLKTGFWKMVDDQYDGLSVACGCYLFGLRAGKGMRPWYVGKAQRQSFLDECFKPDKLVYYNETIGSKQGVPVMFLIGKKTGGGNKFAKPTGTKNGHGDISFLEQHLIGKALNRNSDLCNIKSTKLYSELVVPGVFNSPQGNPGGAAKQLKVLLGL